MSLNVIRWIRFLALVWALTSVCFCTSFHLPSFLLLGLCHGFIHRNLHRKQSPPYRPSIAAGVVVVRAAVAGIVHILHGGGLGHSTIELLHRGHCAAGGRWPCASLSRPLARVAMRSARVSCLRVILLREQGLRNVPGPINQKHFPPQSPTIPEIHAS